MAGSKGLKVSLGTDGGVEAVMVQVLAVIILKLASPVKLTTGLHSEVVLLRKSDKQKLSKVTMESAAKTADEDNDQSPGGSAYTSSYHIHTYPSSSACLESP